MLDTDNQIADNLFEMKLHGTHDFPFVIYKRHFGEKRLNYISTHWHPEIEMVYVQSGKISYSVNEKTYELKEGEAMLVSSCELHGCKMLTDSIWYAVLFDSKMIYGFEESIIKTKYFNQQLFHNILLDQNQTNLLKNIINLHKEDKDYELQITSNLLTLYSSLARNISDVQISTSSKATSYRLKCLLEYINANYSKKLKIEDLCKAISLCRSEVCKLFKEKLNTTFTEYLMKLRLEKSIALLLSDEINITQISEMVGFSSSAYFAESFKKAFNVTPLEYKKIHKKQD